ncbi:carbohydrate kinase family protein [Neptunicoccus cionae]|uniref:Carbohydrate kinase n=1 Tax=Neptunicoccus cionae TaxID=2035344 RepID=A0A916VSM5_9RHOB|nr:carbohydrate kinase [Amylibacter cionae]GGA27343.1 carbohydrate kinase [Amylibacter cionae]
MILCCGEALIDMIPKPTLNGVDGFVAHTGGAVFNTSVALGRLGMDSGLLTGLSTDLFGAQLQRALADSNVDTAHAIVSDRPTTLAFVKLQDGQAKYDFYDENSAGRMIAPENLPQLPDTVNALFFGGISLASMPCAQTYETLLTSQGDGRVVMIDPNIRENFITDETAYRARLKRMIAMADIVKISDEDLGWLIVGARSYEEKATELLSSGPQLVILTKGSEGACGFLRGGAQVSVPAQKVEVADTVGAGDTFNAGVLASLAQSGALNKQAIASLSKDTLEKALALGARVAGIVVSRAGANPPWHSEL